MNPAASFAVTAGLLFAATSTTLAIVVYALRTPILRRVRSPSVRADVAWLLGVLPQVAALLLVLCAAAPSVPALAGLDRDHCLDHGGHGHFCPMHAPVPPPTAMALAALLGGWTLIRAGRLILGEVNGARRVRVLSHLGRSRFAGKVEEIWVPGPPRLCHAIGWWRPKVLVSDSIGQLVHPDELRAALAHEHAHHRRRDPMAILVLRAAGVLQPAVLSQIAEREFREAAEMAADAAAAYEVGDALVVASALVQITRISIAVPGLAMGCDAVERRVLALFALPSGEAAHAFALPLAAATLVIMSVVTPLFGTGETHHVLGLHQSIEGMLEVAMGLLGHA